MATSDTPATEPGPLNENSAIAAFASFLEPPKAEPKEGEAPVVETPVETPLEAAVEKTDVEEEASDPDETITIEVDGKAVEIKKSELPDLYKSGLRQADYTKKTTEVAEQRKAAEAEVAKAAQERHQYATSLQKLAVQLEGALEQQQNIDWDALIASDPVEALKQQHLLQKRQAAYQQTLHQLQGVDAQTKAEQAKKLDEYRSAQQQELLAKLPDWKDTQKATAEAALIKSYLKEQVGFDDAAINGITDHRAVLLARDAMLYRQMLSKAQAAAKKVAAAPQKVVRPGVTEGGKPDQRTAAMQRLDKTGRVEDAAEAFKSFL
jgi:hypothetical protein